MKRYLSMIITAVAAITAIVVFVRKLKELKIEGKLSKVSFNSHLYENHLKRGFDVFCSLMAIICFGWLYIIVAVLVKIKLGSPVIFKQPRPGKDGKIFNMYKFRTMTDEKDEEGNLLPDEVRLTSFGKKLRATSLDELPEAFNILKGDMSIIGPRPQLVRDMVFMTEEQKKRHAVRPGLSGLAQIKGRNDIDWEDKLNWDLKYIQKITFLGDLRIIFETVIKAFVKQEGITDGDMATAEDYGDYLLHNGKVDQEEYDEKQEEAKRLLNNEYLIDGNQDDLVSIIMPSYNTADFISETIDSVLNQSYKNWELIIVDDCSTDNTDEIIKKYLSDQRIRYLKNEKNSGAAVSRNYALREAKGKWIAFLDSDDLWLPEKLELQVNFMKYHNYNFSYTSYEEIDENGNSLNRLVTGPKKITKQGMFAYCWPGCLTVMYDAQYVGLIQIQDIKKNNDYAMWLQVCKKADCYLLDKTLAKYRRGRQGSVSTQSIKTLIGWHYKLFRECEGKNRLHSIFNTGVNLFFGVMKKKIFVKSKEMYICKEEEV